ncbi:hypothetical protein FC65_GL001617 [Ligilactobacillus acidipiscis DSM 15836]|uniref:SGNH hydrolase-type esterase domain-containing protein n=1 Tax=Ligilactobacillus acidipiscis DSM 15836 TaxID=1423716 RepID=A0ABR5PKP4_9LACO|nr:SGNH/GDSL hydrolase family protein [Ligilactobacillus acidipiscis]KRM28715.1 hypothetical protein FC65_GL001617 [Ligilactobacillus acidipiscis DSM 15836]GAW63379.1 lipase/esterase [Ligilactobacillus acidipiscis]GEN19588.1 hypothetical protein LAC02_28690 [Ligilactobacillus acidipiscis]
MVERAQVDYRDATPFDQSKLQDLQTIKDAILHKQTGIDVRGPLAQIPDALIKLLEDASDMEYLGAISELIEARGQFETLGIHETAQDNQIQTTDARSINSLQKSQDAIAMAKATSGGGPKETFSNKAALTAKYPNGASGMYVTQDNGHWWIWNSGWQDGGIWQSTGLADNAVDSPKLSKEARANGVNFGGGPIIKNWTTGYIANKAKQDKDGVPEGTIVTNSNFSLTQPIIVHKGDIISVTGYGDHYSSMISFWDANGQYSQSLHDGISVQETIMAIAPSEGFIRISNWTYKLSNNNVIVKRYPKLMGYTLPDKLVGSVEWENLPLLWDTRSYIGSDANTNHKNEYTHTHGIDEKYQVSQLFYVTSGTVVTVRGGGSKNLYVLAEFQSDGQTFVGGLVTGEGKGGEYSYRLDHNAYLRAGTDTSVEPNPKISTSKQGGASNSNLTGKRINMLGDSYVKNNNDSVGDTWHNKLAIKYNMTYRNYGVNGNGLIDPSRNGTPVVDRYQDMDDDADYVIVIGGKNDYNGQYSIADFKTGVAKLIKGLVIKYPKGKIAFFTPWSIGDTDTKSIKLNEYAQAIEDECNLFGIACFNSSKHSNITPWDANFRKNFMQSDHDVSHLNHAGHERFLPTAEAFIKSL